MANSRPLAATGQGFAADVHTGVRLSCAKNVLLLGLVFVEYVASGWAGSYYILCQKAPVYSCSITTKILQIADDYHNLTNEAFAQMLQSCKCLFS